MTAIAELAMPLSPGLIVILGTVIFIPFLTAGKSPHTLLRACARMGEGGRPPTN